MAFATLLPVSLQLDGLLMMWKFHQARQNDAIRAAFLRKRNYSLQRIHSGNLDEEFSSPLIEIPVGKTKISVTEPDHPLLWPHRKFYKGFKGKPRSRKPGQPGQPGSYEEALSSD